MFIETAHICQDDLPYHYHQNKHSRHTRWDHSITIIMIIMIMIMIINPNINIITVTGWVVSITRDEAKALLFCLTALWSPIIYIIHFKCHHHHHHQHHTSSSPSLSAAAEYYQMAIFHTTLWSPNFLKAIITIWICWQREKCEWHPVLYQGSHIIVLAASTRNCDYSWLCQCVPLWRSPRKMKGGICLLVWNNKNALQ